MFLFKFFSKIFWLAVILWFLGFAYFISLVPAKQTDDGKVVTDAAVVLTGGKKRIEEGFALLKHEKVKRLFITGVGDKATDGEILSRSTYLSSSQIELGREAKSTEGNATEAKNWIEKNNIKSITLVTASYHMPRSMLEFKGVLLPDVMIIAHPVFPASFRIKEFWQHPGSIKLLVLEYNKTLLLLYKQKIRR